MLIPRPSPSRAETWHETAVQGQTQSQDWGQEEARVRLCFCQVALLHRGPGGMENAFLMCETEFIKGVGLVVKAKEREGGRDM